MKKILHQKVNTEIYSVEDVFNFHKCINQVVKEEFNDEYIVITTPTDLSVLEDNQAIITIDAKEYTLQELQDVIEKAAQYDDLCK